jgi:hypothetical protein
MNALGLSDAFEITTRGCCYPVLRQNWEDACARYYGRLFEGRITLDSSANEVDLQLCIRRFAAGKVDEAMAEFDPSIPRSEVIRFLNQEAAAYCRRPGRPLAERSARTALLQMWLHTGLWLLSNHERAWLINRTFRSPLNVTEEGIKKAIGRLGLIGWSAFPRRTVLPEPPGRIVRHPDGKIDLSWGQWEEQAVCHQTLLSIGT